MSKKDYRAAQGKAEMEDLQNKKNFLKSFYIFRYLSDSAITSLVKNMEEKHCSRGQVILREHQDVSDKMYLVKQGEFKSHLKVVDFEANERQKLDFKTFFAENKQAVIMKLQLDGEDTEDPILPQSDLLNMAKFKRLTNQ